MITYFSIKNCSESLFINPCSLSGIIKKTDQIRQNRFGGPIVRSITKLLLKADTRF
ncbi:hypothetical protein BN8_p06829 (plasmid) [Fibrisoma limi BUZ 3]|uniref:Uncharacterized protein n=1 Tax=Fibrisoma limi BUZ 3 TaxID=1185876 RepID=I2GU31_9BACT|nr:hypothetical protein BN8_p06829 [Fibrisoma limi BUZ 3]